MNKELNYRLDRYKQKYYLNLIFKGSIYIFAVLLSAFLFLNFVEYYLYFSTTVRTILFFGYLIICGFVLYKWLFVHVFRLFIKSKQISDEKAAATIGNHFPDVDDKLLNLIQLSKIKSENKLLLATIDQRSNQMMVVPFEQAISLKENIRYIKYLILPFIVTAALAIFSPTTITEPAKRIIQFNKEFVPLPPFQFNLENEQLMAFRNEDFILNLSLTGDELPENVYLVDENRKVKLQRAGTREYTYNFEKIQESAAFRFEAAGYFSQQYQIEVVNRPNIRNFTVSLDFPNYLNRAPEHLENVGSFQVPEGSNITWRFSTADVDQISLKFGSMDASVSPESSDNQVFEFNRQLMQSDEYAVNLKNSYSENKEVIKYTIEAISDEFPKINLDQLRDTVLFQYLIFGGNVSDDHGLSDLNLHYKMIRNGNGENQPFEKINLFVDRSKTSQSFYYHWKLEDFDLGNGEKIEYYLQVRDNDGINGRKATKTAHYTFEIPTADEMRNDLKISSESAENQIDKTLENARELNEDLEDLDNKLKGKKELSWQDQKQIEDLIKRRETLNEAIKKLQEQFDADNKKRDRFDTQQDEVMKEKMAQLQELMDELLDEETKKLYQELQRLLEEQGKMDDMKDVIDKLNNKEDNLEREIERTLELFKKMKFEMELSENIDQMNELAEKQKKAAENSEEKNADQESLLEEQQELSEEFQELQQEMQEMQELNQSLERPQPMQNTSEEQQSVEQQQKQAEQNLKENQKKKASKAQQGASQQMQKMAEKMQAMQSMMMESQMNLNLNMLRDILDNLVKLSFEQEDIMVNFRKVHQSDPRFLELSQKQLKIKDDAQVIQDSLISLSKEDFRIQAVVTRKVSEMNQYMDESVEAIKERKKGEAIGKQQFVMTTINDLALMLDDVMSQMMNLLGYGELKGLTRLRENITKRLLNLDVSADSEGVLLADSAGHALDIVLREMLKPGDVVLVDEPSSFNFSALTQLYNVKVVGVPMTSKGRDTDLYEKLVIEHKPKIFLINSVLHNPTGITIDPRDAYRILGVSLAHGVTIIEDDVYGDFDESRTIRLAALDGLKHVVYISSFSKTISGACRCGYIAANRDLIERCTRLKAESAYGNSNISSQIVSEVLYSGGYRRWLQSTIRQLREDRQYVVGMLEKVGFEIPHIPIGGMFVWARLPNGLNSEIVARAALKDRLILAPGSLFSPTGNCKELIRFNVSQSTNPEIWKILGKLLSNLN